MGYLASKACVVKMGSETSASGSSFTPKWSIASSVLERRRVDLAPVVQSTSDMTVAISGG